ncbi:MAG: S-layer homology domain-containing protein, partial [Parcubacteria group bacterium]
TTFAPNDYITRAELTKMAVNGFNVPSVASLDNNEFVDITSADWYTPYVLAAKEGGVIEGYEGGVFSPNGNVNRAEAMKILIEAAGFTDVDNNFYTNFESKEGWWYAAFTDVPITEWFAKYIGYASTNGMVSGYDDGLFHPEWLITRAEAAKIISLILDLQ